MQRPGPHKPQLQVNLATDRHGNRIPGWKKVVTQWYFVLIILIAFAPLVVEIYNSISWSFLEQVEIIHPTATTHPTATAVLASPTITQETEPTTASTMPPAAATPEPPAPTEQPPLATLPTNEPAQPILQEPSPTNIASPTPDPYELDCRRGAVIPINSPHDGKSRPANTAYLVSFDGVDVTGDTTNDDGSYSTQLAGITSKDGAYPVVVHVRGVHQRIDTYTCNVHG